VTELEVYRRKELRKAFAQREAAQSLIVHLDACQVEALIKAARNSLEALKKSISTNAVVSSGNCFQIFVISSKNTIINADGLLLHLMRIAFVI